MEHYTFFMIKPEGVERGLIGEMITRMEKRGFTVVFSKVVTPDENLAKQHYAEHADKAGIFPKMIAMLTAGSVMALVLRIKGDFGIPAFQTLRNMLGHYDPDQAMPGTIRHEYGNFTHGSDSVESVKREIGLWFPEVDLEKLD